MGSAAPHSEDSQEFQVQTAGLGSPRNEPLKRLRTAQAFTLSPHEHLLLSGAGMLKLEDAMKALHLGPWMK